MTLDLFSIPLASLKRTEGAKKDFRLTGAMDGVLSVGLTTLPAGREILIVGSLESAGDGVLVTATLSLDLDLTCGRCLIQFSQMTKIDLQELFVYPEKHQAYEDEDVSYIDNETIDLSDSIRDAIILDQVLSPVCRPDCLGLCPECGSDLNSDPDHGHGPGVDSRWLTLSEWGKIA